MNADDLTRSAEHLTSHEGIDPWRALMLVLLRQLDRLDIPAAVRPALSVAELYWQTDDGNVDDLVSAKEECWRYLESFTRGTDLSERAGRRARAVLCVLEPAGDDESRSMTAEWFADVIGSDA